MLDSDTCVYVHRNRPPQVLKRFEALTEGEAVVSVVTFGELLYGAAKSAKRTEALQTLEAFKRVVHVLPMDEAVAEAYGVIRAGLERRGELIGNNDLWIAAHALSASLTLVTNNESEFSRVKGLKIQNWTV